MLPQLTSASPRETRILRDPDRHDASEESLEDLYENAPCGYLSAAPSGEVVRVNTTFLDWTGYSADQVLGRPFADLLSVGSRLLYETRCVPLLRVQGEIREVALAVHCPDGRTLSVLVNSSVRSGSGGQPGVTRTAVFDATRRQDYERELLSARRAAERSELRVRVLQEASATLGAATSEESAASALAEVARGASDATSTSFLRLDPGADTLQLLVGDAQPLGGTVPLDAARPESEAVRQRRVIAVSSIDEAEKAFPAVVAELLGARLQAMIAAPLLEDGAAPLGVLACYFGRTRQFDDDEVELLSALARQATQVLGRIRLQDELRHLARHDTLTGLVNRDVLEERLSQVLSTIPDRRALAVIFLDLDGFKSINDELGHAVGDAVLMEVSARLRRSVRTTDTVARFGGDEFVIVCENTGRDGAVRIAERIRKAVRRPIESVPKGFPLTTSIGVAWHQPEPGGAVPEPDALVLRADQAMYRAKRDGRDRHSVVEV